MNFPTNGDFESQHAQWNRHVLEHYYKSLCSNLNKYFQNYNVRLKAIEPQLTDDDVEYLTDHELPSIHINEIESALILLTEVEEPLNQAILGVQGGKTTSMILYIILKIIMCQLENIKCDYVYLTPGDKSISEMTEEDFNNISRFIGKITFTNNKSKKCSYCDITNERYSLHTDKNGCFDSSIIPLTNNVENIEKATNRMQSATKNNTKLILAWDESHHAENNNSIADRIITKGFGPDFYKAAVEGGHKLVMFSATPYPWSNTEKVKKIFLKHSENYIGFNFFEGKVIDESVKVCTPKIVPFPNNIPINPDAAFDINKFKKLKNDYVLDEISSPEEYFLELIKEISNLIKLEIKNGTTGFLSRFICDNKKTAKIIQELKKCLPDLTFIEYFGEVKYGKMIKKIKELKHAKLKFIICVSNRARMSNRFPKEVEVFIDVTKKYTTATSAIQGLAGRACNNDGIVRKVYVSQDNHKEFEEFIKTKGIKGFPQKHSRTKTNRNNKPSQFHHFLKEDKCKILFDVLNRAFGGNLKHLKQQQKLRGHPVLGKDIFSLYPYLEDIYNLPKGCLLMPGQIPIFVNPLELEDDELKSYMFTMRNETGVVSHDGQYIFAAIRTTEHNRPKDKRKINTEMAIDGRKEIREVRGVEIHVKINKETREIERISLPLFKPDQTTKEDQTIPKENSMAHKYF